MKNKLSKRVVTLWGSAILVVIASASLGFCWPKDDDCASAPPEKWSRVCIDAAEIRAQHGDVRAMEGLWAAYPNQNDSARAFYWLVAAGRHGSLGAIRTAVDLCPRQPLINRTSVLALISGAESMDKSTRDDLIVRLEKTCP